MAGARLHSAGDASVASMAPHHMSCTHDSMFEHCCPLRVQGHIPVRAFSETFRNAKRGRLAHDEGRGPAEPHVPCSQLAQISSTQTVSPS